jgi:hypothetical protein
MHTALRIGVAVAKRVRALNPDCHVAFFGLYAALNAAYLLDGVADSCFGGEFERALVDLAEALESGTAPAGTIPDVQREFALSRAERAETGARTWSPA